MKLGCIPTTIAALLVLLSASGCPGEGVPPIAGKHDGAAAEAGLGCGTCYGCCAGGVCHAGNTAEYCGTGGLPCVLCLGGQICNQGSCSNAPNEAGIVPDSGACQDQCTLGDEQCAGGTNSVQTCVNGGGGCTVWSSPTPCQSGQVCSGGKCGSSCTNQCAQGTTKCANTNSYQTCQLMGTGCTDWGSPASCASTQICSGDKCVASCTNQCTQGNTKCAGSSAYQLCQLMGTGCTDWGSPLSCASTQVCSVDKCVASCTNQCTQGNTKCATTSSFQTCQLMGTGCTDWGSPASCPSGQTCTGTSCKCTPQCSGKTCGSDGCGGSCGTCKGYETCNGAVCQINPSSQWRVCFWEARIVTQPVSPSKLGWDSDETTDQSQWPPEAFGDATIGGKWFSTTIQQNTVNPTWHFCTSTLVTAQDLRGSLKLHVWDMDSGDKWEAIGGSDSYPGYTDAYLCHGCTRLFQGLPNLPELTIRLEAVTP